MRSFGDPGSLFAIPLTSDAFAVAQVAQNHGRSGGFGVLDAIFSRKDLSELDVLRLRNLRRARHVYTNCHRTWIDLGMVAPLFPSVKAHYLQWAEGRRVDDDYEAGPFVIERDPLDGNYKRWMRVDAIPAEMSDGDEYAGVDVPQLLEFELRDRWGLSTPLAPRPHAATPPDQLLDHTAVAQIRDAADREGPKWARQRLALAAHMALEGSDYLDAEVGGPALAAACATEDREVARAFRSTLKTVRAVVKRPKSVALRVLDPATSEIAELHQSSGTLDALRAYVEGLQLDDGA